MLTDKYIQQLNAGVKIYKKHDSNGLYLYVTPSGTKLWRYRYRNYNSSNSESKITESIICLGKYPEVNIKQARLLRDRAESDLKQGIEPRATLKKANNKCNSQNSITVSKVFSEFFSKYSQDKASSTVLIWERNLREFIESVGDRPITEVSKADIRFLLERALNVGKIQTAKRILWAIRKLFRWAVAMGYRNDDPTIFLEVLFPASQPTQHHAAVVDPKEVADLLTKIHGVNSGPSVKYCLMILPYLPLRSIEIRGARWDEINLEQGIWTIPASRSASLLDGGGTKMRRDFQTPLSDQVVRLFTELRQFTGSCALCFPGRDASKIISDVALQKVLNNIGFKGKMTLHGFRTIFSTFVNTYKGEWSISSDAIEFQLEHIDNNKMRRAYNRADYWEERKKLMQVWANYLDSL